MSRVFKALGDPHRRRMLDILKDEPGANVNRMADAFGDMTRFGVMKHLRVLEQAELVRSIKVGRERKLYLNPVPIQMVYDRWLSDFSAQWSSHLTRFKQELESAKEKKHG